MMKMLKMLNLLIALLLVTPIAAHDIPVPDDICTKSEVEEWLANAEDVLAVMLEFETWEEVADRLMAVEGAPCTAYLRDQIIAGVRGIYELLSLHGAIVWSDENRFQENFVISNEDFYGYVEAAGEMYTHWGIAEGYAATFGLGVKELNQ